MFQGVSHATLQGGGAQTFPKFLGPACTHTVQNSNQILRGDQIKGRKIFTGSVSYLICLQ